MGRDGHRWVYRPALDGLRAVAVLAVFVYHLGYPWLPGGFVGVDVFFVLSGYLITSLLLVECERTGRIDLGQFWLRRARRLLPALVLMLVAVAIWLSVTAPPFELPLRRRDLLWTLFYGANWHFIASGQDYFAQFMSASPLRHAWSLSIEEQFYFVWPLILLWAAVRMDGNRRAVMMICGAGITLSAIAAAWLFHPGDPSRAYYGTDARIHQPLVGALLAVLMRAGVSASFRRAGSIVSGLSLLGLVAAFLWLDARSSAYYFGVSLALAGGAAAMIWSAEAAPSGLVARALSWPPVRGVGQISYGLYLWHWPVILAVTAAPWPLALLPGSTGVNLTRMLVTFAIAIASFHAVEEPVRRGRVPWLGASAWRFAAAATLTIAAVAGLAVSTTRVSQDTENLLELEACPATETPCLRHEGPRGAPVVAVIGDSIARSLDPAFMTLAAEHGWTYVLAAANGCRISPLLTIYEGQIRPVDTACHDATPRLLDRLVADWNPRTIIAFDRWELIDVAGPDGRAIVSGTPAHLSVTEEALTAVTRRLTSRGARLAFIELPPLLPGACSDPARRASPECRPRVGDDPAQTPYNQLFRRVAARVPGVTTISIADTLCPGGVCAWDRDGMVLRFDGLHFTPEASRWLAPALLRQMSAAGVNPG